MMKKFIIQMDITMYMILNFIFQIIQQVELFVLSLGVVLPKVNLDFFVKANKVV